MADSSSVLCLLNNLVSVKTSKRKEKEQYVDRVVSLLNNHDVLASISTSLSTDKVTWANLLWKVQAAFETEFNDNVKKCIKYTEGRLMNKPALDFDVCGIWARLVELSIKYQADIPLDAIFATCHCWMSCQLETKPELNIVADYGSRCMIPLSDTIQYERSHFEVHPDTEDYTNMITRLLRSCRDLVALGDGNSLVMYEGAARLLVAVVHRTSGRMAPGSDPFLSAYIKTITVLAKRYATHFCDGTWSVFVRELCTAISQVVRAFGCDQRVMLRDQLTLVVIDVVMPVMRRTLFHKKDNALLDVILDVISLHCPDGHWHHSSLDNTQFTSLIHDLYRDSVEKFIREMTQFRSQSECAFKPLENQLQFVARVMHLAHEMPVSVSLRSLLSDFLIREETALKPYENSIDNEQSASWQLLSDVVDKLAGNYNITPWIRLVDKAMRSAFVPSDDAGLLCANTADFMYKTNRHQVAEVCVDTLTANCAKYMRGASSADGCSQVYRYCLRSVNVQRLKSRACILMAHLLHYDCVQLTTDETDRLASCINDVLITENSLVDVSTCVLLSAFVQKCDFVESSQDTCTWTWRRRLIGWCLATDLSAFAVDQVDPKVHSNLLVAMHRSQRLSNVMAHLLSAICFVRPNLLPVNMNGLIGDDTRPPCRLDSLETHLSQMYGVYTEPSTSTHEPVPCTAQLVPELLQSMVESVLDQLQTIVQQCQDCGLKECTDEVVNGVVNVWLFCARVYSFCVRQYEDTHSMPTDATLLPRFAQAITHVSDLITDEHMLNLGTTSNSSSRMSFTCSFLTQLRQMLLEDVLEAVMCSELIDWMSGLANILGEKPTRAKRPRIERRASDEGHDQLGNAAVSCLLVLCARYTDMDNVLRQNVLQHLLKQKQANHMLCCLLDDLNVHGVEPEPEAIVAIYTTAFEYCAKCDDMLIVGNVVYQLVIFMQSHHLNQFTDHLTLGFRQMATAGRVVISVMLGRCLATLFHKVPDAVSWNLDESECTGSNETVEPVTLLNQLIGDMELTVMCVPNATRVLARLSLDPIEYVSLMQDCYEKAAVNSEVSCIRVLHICALILNLDSVDRVSQQRALITLIHCMHHFVHVLPRCQQIMSNLVPCLTKHVSMNTCFLATQLVFGESDVPGHGAVVDDNMLHILESLTDDHSYAEFTRSLIACQLVQSLYISDPIDIPPDRLCAEFLVDAVCGIFTFSSDDQQWRLGYEKLMNWLDGADTDGTWHKNGKIKPECKPWLLAGLYARRFNKDELRYWMSADSVLRASQVLCALMSSDGQMVDAELRSLMPSQNELAHFLVHYGVLLTNDIQRLLPNIQISNCHDISSTFDELLQCGHDDVLLPLIAKHVVVVYDRIINVAINVKHSSGEFLSMMEEMSNTVMSVLSSMLDLHNPSTVCAVMPHITRAITICLPVVYQLMDRRVQDMAIITVKYISQLVNVISKVADKYAEERSVCMSIEHFARLVPVLDLPVIELTTTLDELNEFRADVGRLSWFSQEIDWLSTLDIEDFRRLSHDSLNKIKGSIDDLNESQLSRVTQNHIESVLYRILYVHRHACDQVNDAWKQSAVSLICSLLRVYQRSHLNDQDACQSLLTDVIERVIIKEHKYMKRDAMSLMVTVVEHVDNILFASHKSRSIRTTDELLGLLTILKPESGQQFAACDRWICAFHSVTPRKQLLGIDGLYSVSTTLSQLLKKAVNECREDGSVLDKLVSMLCGVVAVRVESAVHLGSGDNRDKQIAVIGIQALLTQQLGACIGLDVFPDLLFLYAQAQQPPSRDAQMADEIHDLLSGSVKYMNASSRMAVSLAVHRMFTLSRAMNKCGKSVSINVKSQTLVDDLQLLGCHLSCVYYSEQTAASIINKSQPLVMFYDSSREYVNQLQTDMSGEDERKVLECKQRLTKSLLALSALDNCLAVVPDPDTNVQYRSALLARNGDWSELVQLYSATGASDELKAALDKSGVHTSLLVDTDVRNVDYNHVLLLGRWQQVQPVKRLDTPASCLFTLAQSHARSNTLLYETHRKNIRTQELSRAVHEMQKESMVVSSLMGAFTDLNRLNSLHALLNRPDHIGESNTGDSDDPELSLMALHTAFERSVNAGDDARASDMLQRVGQAVHRYVQHLDKHTHQQQSALNVMTAHMDWLQSIQNSAHVTKLPSINTTFDQCWPVERSQLGHASLQLSAGHDSLAASSLQRLITSLLHDDHSTGSGSRRVSFAQSTMDDLGTQGTEEEVYDLRTRNQKQLLAEAYILLGECQERGGVHTSRDPKTSYHQAIDIIDGNNDLRAANPDILADARHKLADYLFNEHQRLDAYLSSDEYKSRCRRFTYCTSRMLELKEEHKLFEKDSAKAIEICRRYRAYEQEAINIKQGEQKVKNEHSQAASQACYAYLHAIKLSNKHDLDVFRIGRLWLPADSQQIASTVSDFVSSVSTHKWLPIWNQIVARLSTHPMENQPSFKKTIDQVVNDTLQQHPFHTFYSVICLANSTHVQVTDVDGMNRKQQASKLVQSFSGSSVVYDQMEKLAQAYLGFNDRYQNVLKHKDNASRRKSERMHSSDPLLAHSYNRVALPTQSVPVSSSGDYSQIAVVQRFEVSFNRAMSGVSAPVLLVAVTSDGIARKHILKIQKNEDLRQDALMQQVFGVANQLFDAGGFAGRMRTYVIQPLSSNGGVLEFCTGTSSLLELVTESQKLFADPSTIKAVHAANVKLGVVGEDQKLKPSEKKKRLVEAFLDACLAQPLTFGRFFGCMFATSHEWFAARNVYTTSVAVSSIVGHILGIGDRHLSNILIDTLTAEVVHIDFGIGFEQGRKLRRPELVPFRLTREFVAPMGLAGVEGMFTQQCCTTLALLTSSKASHILTGMISVLLYDPLSNWALTDARKDKAQPRDLNLTQSAMGTLSTPDGKRRRLAPSQALNTSRTSNSTAMAGSLAVECTEDQSHNLFAQQTMARITEKLQGRELVHMKPMTTQQQVNYLITEARRLENLCELYHGWRACV